ncbi:MAG: dihydroorotase [actinobacterium acAcidi]|jgi:dihydroorotase|nr:MAG: dihydroorotase [actinobacterium acAcidi]
MSVVFRGGNIVTNEGVVHADLVVQGGQISEIGSGLAAKEVVDISGLTVFPGFVDLHAHLREPGREDTETIETGSRAGAKGGYTAVIAMPNTNPAQDNVPTIEFVRLQGQRAGLLEVIPSGCITMGREGKALAPMAELAKVGVKLFTDDGSGVQDPLLMRRAMEYSKELNVVLGQHCEVSSLTQGAVMHECGCSSDLGVPGWPSIAEELMVHRDIELARLTGARIHFLHLSTAGSVKLVRQAKLDGLPVTAEVTPHHLSLTAELLRGFDATFKVNPPLRTISDIDALKAGVLDGTIDAIATDHAPHARRDKELPLDQAPPGMLGLETALGVTCAALDLDPLAIAQVMSVAPARIAGIADRQGNLPRVGVAANLCFVDLNATWMINPETMASKSTNTPFVGRQLRGKVVHTMFNGDLVVRDGEALK